MPEDFEDPLAERLFEAARREKPREAARARAAQAVAGRRPGWSWLWPKLAVAATVTLISGVVFTQLRVEESAGISAERVPAEVGRTPKPIAPSPAVAPSPSVTQPVVPPSARAGAAPAKLRVATQQQELELLDHARELLAAGNPARALEELTRYDRTASERSLGAEAALLRIQALAAAGRHDESAALARRFIANHPNSPLADRARSFAGSSADAPDAGIEGTDR